MRRPRKPVPPNTVTVRPFVATMTQIGQFISNGAPDAVGRPPLAIVCLLVRPEARLQHLPD
jgi:hypothetical protein